MPFIPATRHPNGVRLLSLDGGGVRGIAALIVLDAIMKRVQERTKSKEPCRPADYFELAAGTSTGGIIGLMLFRLRMTTQQAITMYDEISEEVFSPKVLGYNISNVFGNTVGSMINNSKTLFHHSRFDDTYLKSAIGKVVGKYGLDENDRTLKGDAPLFHPKAGKVILCTTAQNRAETVLMRSYKTDVMFTSSIVNNAMKEAGDKLTICLATRATSAAPTFFPEVRWKAGKTWLTFWDGGLLNNNPIDQLWYSKYDLARPDQPMPPIAAVISLGTGYVRPNSPTSSWFRLAGVASSVMDLATNTNAKAKDFSRLMKKLNRRPEYAKTKYVRFNPPLGFNDIGLADYTKMDFLKEITTRYVENEKNQEYIEKAVNAICP